MHSKAVIGTALFACALLSSIAAAGQTVSPPVAEYRGKAQGMFELRNDNDYTAAVLLEVNSFSVDQNGNLGYEPLKPTTHVDLGETSFVLRAHETRYVFYKAWTSERNAWFAILSTFTKASMDRPGMRINYVLPHVVYLNQKEKLKKGDVAVSAMLVDGRIKVEVRNLSEKIGRVEGLTTLGRDKVEAGGFPAFPGNTRYLILPNGAARAVKVTFEDGFAVEVAVTRPAA